MQLCLPEKNNDRNTGFAGGKDRNKKHNHLICIGHSFNIDNPYSGKHNNELSMT